MKNQMFRQVILFTFCLLSSNIFLQAQPPLRFSYQSIIRNSGGQAMPNQAVALRLSILQGSDNGSAVYVETHIGNTNSAGLISLQIGGGTIVSGSMTAIDWTTGPYFIKSETDPEAGTNYSITGTSPLLSVPFSLHSNTSGTAANGVPGGGSHGQVLTLCNGVLTWTTGGNCPSNLPTLTTTAASAITATTSTSGGNISSDGGGSVTSRGVCWSISQNPTIALSTKTSNGIGTGSFSSSLTDLSPNTLYYLRAYATNSVGTAYGNQVSFTTSNSIFTPGGGVTDIEGNNYQSIIIGSQEWMKENLKVSKYKNGDPISTNIPDWGSTTTGAYLYYNNNSLNNNIFGKLYNWFAVNDPRGLCPTNWHVPSINDWVVLENNLGGTDIAGGKMKANGNSQAGTGIWQYPNTDATNESGFSALPGGIIYEGGSSSGISTFGYWWSSFQDNPNSAIHRSLSYNIGSIQTLYGSNIRSGLSVRCLKD